MSSPDFDVYQDTPVERFTEAHETEHPANPLDPKPIIYCHNLHKTYLLGVEGVPALRGVSLSIERGEFVVILGTSGGGKTSLLNLIGTIDRPTKGELRICDQSINAQTTDAEFARLRLLHIGFVFQTFNLIPSMTAQQNVELPMILAGQLSTEQISARSRQLLERVGLGHRYTHLPSQLSGGEQQRVTIARAIANRPQLLLLDEPTGDLDTVNSTLILGLLCSLNRQEGITCLMVTHDQGLKQYAHRVVNMVDGKVLKIDHIDPQVRLAADTELQHQCDVIQGKREAQARQESQREYTELRENAHNYYPFLQQDEEIVR